jgi:hypothetical protein
MKKLFIVILIVVSCSHSSGPNMITNPPQPMGPPTFQEVAQFMGQNCSISGCHGATGTQPIAKPQNLSTPAAAYAALVGVRAAGEPAFLRVQPGNPDSSYLIIKLVGRNQVGLAMPPGGSIGAARIQRWRDWITAGAVNN